MFCDIRTLKEAILHFQIYCPDFLERIMSELKRESGKRMISFVGLTIVYM